MLSLIDADSPFCHLISLRRHTLLTLLSEFLALVLRVNLPEAVLPVMGRFNYAGCNVCIAVLPNDRKTLVSAIEMLVIL